MNIKIVIVLFNFFTLFTGIQLISEPRAFSSESWDSSRVLILYDSPRPVADDKIGLIYAIMLRNLLGHFHLDADIESVNQYTSGKIDRYLASFYLGSYYNNSIPKAFLLDASQTKRNLIWFRYNIWQLTLESEFNFIDKFGFNFVDLRSLDSKPDSAHPHPGFFDTVIYKGQSMIKYYNYDPKTDQIAADPDAGVTEILNPTILSIVSTIKNSKTMEEVPYIIHSKNFWYVADIPFSYIGPRDRYLVICDVLHDMLEIQHPETHSALVRLEDVSANVLPESLNTLSDYLESKKIPFSIATIPFYVDPLGHYNEGTPLQIHMSDAHQLLDALHYAQAKGGAILMHGYTHQYASSLNLFTAVSGDDYEFWNAKNNTSTDEDSEKWILDRLDAGLSEMIKNGLPPFAWETPHYQASPLANRTFSKKFQTTYQRVVYYTSDQPSLTLKSPRRDFFASQFFPYVIYSDYYGQKIIPENLGDIEYDISSIDSSSNIVYTWRDIVENARYSTIVRDGFASFFFHPFWLDPSLSDLNAFSDFKQTIDGISKLHYQWIDPKKL